MIETKIHLKNIIGSFLILIGIAGIGYLGWVYVVWGVRLPRLNMSLFVQPSKEFVIQNGGGFGGLLYEEPQPTIEAKEGSLFVDRPVNDKTSGNILGTQQSDLSSVRLTIPVLNINDVSVELDVNGDDEGIYDTVLTRAVAHLRNSAHPGEFGNTFLFGHSKLPIIAGTDYESIFTNLPKVKVGDIIKIVYQNQEFVYQVGQTGVVDPNDVFILNQPTSRKMLTVMTCIPPGFDSQRYVAVGELVSVNKLEI